MHDMIGYYPSYFFVGCWSVITPAICAGVFCFKVLLKIVSKISNISLLAVHLEECCVPGLPLPMVGSRCGLLHGWILHDLHPCVCYMAVVHYSGNLERGFWSLQEYSHPFKYFFLQKMDTIVSPTLDLAEIRPKGSEAATLSKLTHL